MLNEERVVLMTELAIFEEKANHKLQPATRYTKRDYITLCTIGGIVFGSLLFVCIYGVAIAAVMSTAITNISLLLAIVFVILGVILYALFMYFYLNNLRRGAIKRYERSKKLVKKQRQAYAKLMKLYEKEEAQDVPENWG
ncbi:MAG: hypothetical protein E7281_03955 [Lachnospiraceae bacterium]|nr:hypothetical protein [Lachnospiraceae bacterium]